MRFDLMQRCKDMRTPREEGEHFPNFIPLNNQLAANNPLRKALRQAHNPPYNHSLLKQPHFTCCRQHTLKSCQWFYCRVL